MPTLHVECAPSAAVHRPSLGWMLARQIAQVTKRRAMKTFPILNNVCVKNTYTRWCNSFKSPNEFGSVIRWCLERYLFEVAIERSSQSKSTCEWKWSLRWYTKNNFNRQEWIIVNQTRSLAYRIKRTTPSLKENTCNKARKINRVCSSVNFSAFNWHEVEDERCTAKSYMWSYQAFRYQLPRFHSQPIERC